MSASTASAGGAGNPQAESVIRNIIREIYIFRVLWVYMHKKCTNGQLVLRMHVSDNDLESRLE